MTHEKPIHALLGGSNAARWLACPPSARLEAQILKETGDEKRSKAADEGTVAHALAEAELRVSTQRAPESIITEVEKNAFYSKDMSDYVADYVAYVTVAYSEALAKDTQAAIKLEQNLDFSEYVPGGHGYADAVVIADGRLEVFDLKYGRFVPVVAKGNPQIRLYALGALAEFDWLYNIHTVKLTIVQPRNTGMTSEEMSVEDLREWGESVKPIARQAARGEGKTKAGEHCRFCLAAPKCRAFYKEVTAAKSVMDREPALLTDDELAMCLRTGEHLYSYLQNVKQYAIDRAVQDGHMVPGYKLVKGRSSASYGDFQEIRHRLLNAGFKEADFLKPTELIGVTAMKKLVSTRRFDELLGDLMVRTDGKLTLAPVDDKRPVYDPAEGFTDLDKETGK